MCHFRLLNSINLFYLHLTNVQVYLKAIRGYPLKRETQMQRVILTWIWNIKYLAKGFIMNRKQWMHEKGINNIKSKQTNIRLEVYN